MPGAARRNESEGKPKIAAAQAQVILKKREPQRKWR